MPSEEGKHWKPLVMTTGDQEIFEKKDPDYNQEAVIRFLTFDREYQNSILRCLGAARENGRSIREIISSEMWEHLNNFYLELTSEQSLTMALEDPHRFFQDHSDAQPPVYRPDGLHHEPWRGVEFRPASA